MQTEQIRITCSGCGLEGRIEVPQGHPESLGPGAAERGWSFRGDDALCPECSAARERMENEDGPALVE